MRDNNTSSAAREALTMLNIRLKHDPEPDTIEVGDYTIWMWATSAPYAVYLKKEFLPRWQFNTLPTLLDFLRRNVSRAA